MPKKCADGTYSGDGATSCSNCGAGNYCVNGVQAACSTTGTYQDSATGLTCLSCPVGYKCSFSAKTACTGTQYADGKSTTCDPLSGNMYRDALITTQVKRTCPAGYFVDSSFTICTLCTEEYTCDGTSKTICGTNKICAVGTTGLGTDIPAGSTVTSGSHKSTSIGMCAGGKYRADANTCTDCTAGNKCEDPTTSTKTACGSGTYQDTTGNTICKPCDVGKYCSGSTQTSISAGSTVKSTYEYFYLR